jgi:hypothetical protein
MLVLIGKRIRKLAAQDYRPYYCGNASVFPSEAYLHIGKDPAVRQQSGTGPTITIQPLIDHLLLKCRYFKGSK